MRGKQFDGFCSQQTILDDLFSEYTPVPAIEYVSLDEARGRICAEDLFSCNTLPVVRAAGCDGIAVQAMRFSNGMPDYRSWVMGVDFVRADTGDDFPDEFDAIIMIEEVDLTDDGHITYLSEDIKVAAGDFIRPKGNSIAKGDLLVEKGLPIRTVDITNLAQGRILEVPVLKRPKIAFIPTGSELIPYGTVPKRGQTIDINSFTVKNMLLEMEAEPVVYPIVPDIKNALSDILDEALASADIVILNAGTAKGSEDFNFGILGDRGRLLHHYVSAAPGRPMAVAIVDGKPVINLPGPPLAAFFGCDWCVRALVAYYYGIPVVKRRTVSATLMDDIHTTPSMAVMTKINLVRNGDEFEAWPLSARSTHLPYAMGSNAVYVVPLGQGNTPKGTVIEVELMREIEFI